LQANVRRPIAIILLSLLLFIATQPAHADELHNAAVAAVVGIVVGTAVITIAIVYLVRKNPSLKGCASPTPAGLTLTNEDDRQTYLLTGDIASIKPGERIKISGKKGKKVPTGNRPFIVEKFSKDYGACNLQPATP
jgi:hypothetical protein